MKKLITLLALSCTLCAPAKLTIPADTVRPDGLFNAYVIYGANPTDEQLNSGKYVLPVNIVEVDSPDSQLMVFYAHDGAISHAATKSPVFDLFGQAQTFVVNGDTLTRKEFAGIPTALLNSAKLTPTGAVEVDMRESVHDISSAYRAEQDEEYVWFTKHYTPIPRLKNRIDDFAAYPEGTLFSVNGFLRSRDFVGAIDPRRIEALRFSTYGNKLHVELFVDNKRYSAGSYPASTTIIPHDKVEALTLGNIMSELPANTRFVVVNPAYIIAFPAEFE